MHTRSTHTRRLSLCYTPNASRGKTSAGGSSSMRTVAQPHLRPGGKTSQPDYRVRIRRPRSLISSTKLTDACSTLPSHENDCFGGRGEGWSSERERLRAQPHCQDRCATWHGTRVPPTWPARPRPWPTAAASRRGSGERDSAKVARRRVTGVCALGGVWRGVAASPRAVS